MLGPFVLSPRSVYVHLVMELCEGGDMVDSIIKRGKYTERDAATSVRTMLKVCTRLWGGGGRKESDCSK